MGLFLTPKPETQHKHRLCPRDNQDSTSALCAAGLTHADPILSGKGLTDIHIQPQTRTISHPLPALLATWPLVQGAHFPVGSGSCGGVVRAA